jgi:glycosyltransferase involved in cell wall biosynthesis
MSTPLVSVITTAYNCEKYIKESINSIINQTFRDFEIVVYNDASTDKTWDIVFHMDLFCDHNIFRGDKNVGCGEGRNRAIKQARGKYIAIQDADDISLPERLEKEVNFLEENDDIFCVGAWAIKIKEDGSFIESMTYPRSAHEKIYEDIIVKKNNPIIDPSCMYRRGLFNELGGYDGRWKLVPDFNLWARAAKAGFKFFNFQEALVYYRQHPNSVTNKSEMAVVREHYRMCKEVLGNK